jgi:spermidine/putrescine transport system permease protein
MSVVAGTPSPQAALQLRRRWLLSLPALLIVFLFAVGPLAIIAIYSFLTPGKFGNVEWVFSGEAWFRVLFERDMFDDTVTTLADAHLSIFLRSAWLALATTLLTLIIGFPTAYFIATRPERTRELWLFLVTIPFWTNLLIRTFAIFELTRNEGVINSLLMGSGIIATPLKILYTDTAILMGLVYVFLPLMVLPIYASLEKLDFRLVEAGYDLYATRGKVLRRIIIPLAKPGIIAGSILVFIPALGSYVTARILGGGKNMLIGNFIEFQFGQGRNWPLGAALSMTLMAVVLIALLVYVRNAGAERQSHV